MAAALVMDYELSSRIKFNYSPSGVGGASDGADDRDMVSDADAVFPNVSPKCEIHSMKTGSRVDIKDALTLGS